MFKPPQSIPQDLLLIQDLVGDITSTSARSRPLSKSVQAEQDEDISSSSDSDDELDEVEADLLMKPGDNDDEDTVMRAAIPSDSSSESDSDSESDAEALKDENEVAGATFQDDDIDEEESGPSVTTGTYFQTKNEVIEANITVPTVDGVGPDEILELVGEIMSVVANVVIVKGLAAGLAGRASERALDSDTLLVFEDRKVMGYVYETFGPTYQPMYQVKFNDTFPLDPEKVQVSRQVFHLPKRSNFVFLNQLKKWKGSDASNVHDEEPADDELEFSDDDEEAAFKSQRKRKRGESRTTSVYSSRFATPTPSQMRDQDLVDGSILSANAFDERGPYDIDFSSAGPSRPAPIPYDDPYANEYSIENPDFGVDDAPSHELQEIDKGRERSSYSEVGYGRSRGHDRGRGRGRGSGRSRGDNRRDSGGRDRGRGRGRGWVDRGSGRRDSAGDDRSRGAQTNTNFASQASRSLSPTSLAIARATGQVNSGPPSPADVPSMQPYPQSPSNNWQYAQYQPQAHQHWQQSAQYVQPHINPRFAAQFGMNLGHVHPQVYMQQRGSSFRSNNPRHHGRADGWADEWTVHGNYADVTDSNGTDTHDAQH